jgi:hypothetical protein
VGLSAGEVCLLQAPSSIDLRLAHRVIARGKSGSQTVIPAINAASGSPLYVLMHHLACCTSLMHAGLQGKLNKLNQAYVSLNPAAPSGGLQVGRQ